jgi:hypothetical protein
VLALLLLAACDGSVVGGSNASCTDCDARVERDAGPSSTRPDAGNTSSPDAGGSDAGEPPPPESAPAFMLVGHLGRLMLTCDGGDTWAFDTSKDAAAHCWDMSGGTGPECDHHTWAATGIAYGGGLFAATFGWGSEGEGHGIYTSPDGSDGGAWPERLNGSFNGIAYGNGAWVAGSGGPGVSTDNGATWTQLEHHHYDTPRGTFFAPVDGGRFIVFADGPSVLVSDDGARTFFEPESVAAECGPIGVGGGDAIVMYRNDESAVCVSHDGGHTFVAAPLPGTARSRAVWTGSEFWIWGDGVRYSSADGSSWTSAPIEGGARFHHVARADDGTILAVWSEWGSYYESSALWRSRDGLVWERTAGSAAMNGHPIRGITFGYAPRAACE